MSRTEGPRGYTGDGFAGRDISRDDRACSHDCARANPDVGQQYRSRPDLGFGADRNSSRQYRSRPDHRGIADPDVVLDDRSGVDECAPADVRSGADVHSRQELSTWQEHGALRNVRGRMDECGQRQARLFHRVEGGGAAARGPEAEDPGFHSGGCQPTKITAAADHGEARDLPVGMLGVVVDETDELMIAARCQDLDHDTGMPVGPRTVDDGTHAFTLSPLPDRHSGSSAADYAVWGPFLPAIKTESTMRPCSQTGVAGATGTTTTPPPGGTVTLAR